MTRKRNARPDISGVYAIVSPAGELYIGATKAMRHRWAVHRHGLRHGTHHSDRLQADWNLHGESAFVFKVLSECEESDLVRVEQEFFDRLKPTYNTQVTAGDWSGTPRSEETKRKISDAFKGREFSAEHRAKLSASLKGRVITEDARKKMSLAKKGAKVLNPRRGHRLTDEHKAKIAASGKGRPCSEETRKKRSASLSGENHPNWGKPAPSIKKQQESHPSCIAIQCVETGEIFHSVGAAARRMNGDSSSITKVCRGKQKTAYGFTWKYVEQGDQREAA